MSVTEIKQELARLTDAERLEVLDAAWALLENKDDVESPAWHTEELRVRDQEIANGEAKFVPWEEAKDDIRRRTS